MKTPLFPDVVPTLTAWKASGRTLAIFSSGSVQAQLQFFSFVEDGATTQDVKPFFSAHYDTVNAGPKLEKASYEKICREMGIDASKVTFLTDNVKGMFASLAGISQSIPDRFVIRTIFTALLSRLYQASTSSPASLAQA